MADSKGFVDEESRWKALIERNRAAEKVFFYAVKTTGVFCRPGCSSRLPKREHVEFFDSYKEAKQAGYRPCKRCKPDMTSPQGRLMELIVEACRCLETAEKPPTLKQLARTAGLSPWHFHRLFKEVVGVTPKQYASTQQARRFREGLTSEQTVTAAIYDAGFSSSSRAYDKTQDRLAMKPSDYRKAAEGLTLRYALAQCFLGWVLVAVTDRGICAIELGDYPEKLLEQVQQRFQKAYFEEGGEELTAVIETVIAFIDKPTSEIELPLDIQGTAFQERVWQALRSVPPGKTVSYTDIACQIGSPKAVRAVAQACAANKLAVVVPCHRVVHKDGSLSGYR